jgi:hypothetical protein
MFCKKPLLVNFSSPFQSVMLKNTDITSGIRQKIINPITLGSKNGKACKVSIIAFFFFVTVIPPFFMRGTKLPLSLSTFL